MHLSSYRIYLLDSRGRVDKAQAIDAPDDEAATAIALARLAAEARQGDVEVWCGARRVFGCGMEFA
jgi:hypothetical protein